MRRKKDPKPATQEELDALQDSYRDARAPVFEQYLDCRRTGDNDRAALLWEYAKHLMAQEQDAMFNALHPTTR